jgi:DNA-binding XRE family transcriptional regulator
MAKFSARLRADARAAGLRSGVAEFLPLVTPSFLRALTPTAGNFCGGYHIERLFYIEQFCNTCYNVDKVMADISIKFGKKAKEIRLAKDMSQGDLAKILGVHPTYISGIERGVRNMALKNIRKISQST